MQIYMQCDHGEIEVFLCPEEESLGMGGAEVGNGAVSSAEEATDTESEASPVKAHPARPGLPPPSPPPRLDLDEESRSSDLGQIRNALISASEDFGPMGKTLQLQTLDQEQREYNYISRIRVYGENMCWTKSIVNGRRRNWVLRYSTVAVILHYNVVSQ